MSKKRYERVFEDRNDLTIFDKQEQYRDKESLYLSGDGVVDLLNNQEERIKELESENQRLRDAIDGLTGTMAHMEDLCDGDD